MILHFTNKLGEPIDKSILEKYLNLCKESYSLENYTERHHILPRSIFPEFVNEEWNQVDVPYEIHCLLHEMLWCAYPHVGAFWRPLNFMKSQSPDMKLKLSDAMSYRAKELWKEIKADPVKYNEWCDKRRLIMLERMQPDHPAYELMKQKLREYYDTTPNAKAIRSLASKEMWNDSDMRKKIIDAQKKSAATPEGKQRRSDALKQRYNNVVYYEQHKNKMKTVNSSKEKTDKNRQTILEKWKDPIFASYMLEKISEGKTHRKSSSETMKALWADPIRRKEMMDKRKAKREKKLNEAS